MSRDEIEWGRRRDQRLRDAHLTEVNRRKDVDKNTAAPAAQPSASWLASFWRAFRSGCD